MIYIDNAATTARKPLSVYFSLLEQTVLCSANAGRGAHKKSTQAARVIVDAQDAAAELFNIRKPQNIVFTQNATYALNLAILGTLGADDHAVVTQMEHNSVLRPVHALCSYTVVKADKDGYVAPSDIEKAITPRTKMIITTHASNVCGTVLNINAISKTAKKYSLMYMVDAAQTAGIIPIDNERLGADFIACSGHKGLMGPLGTGILYVNSPRKLKSVITGGTGNYSKLLTQPRIMPEMLHSGTVNTPAIAALKEGIKFVKRHEGIGEYEASLADAFRTMLLNIKNVTVYGASPETGTVAFNINGLDSEETAKRLSGFALRGGFHCAPLAHEALGTQDIGAVRASFGYFNRKSDVHKLAFAVNEAAKNA